MKQQNSRDEWRRGAPTRVSNNPQEGAPKGRLTRNHRDEHFDHHITQIELALDARLWGTSPVVDAVKRLGRRLKRADDERPEQA